MNIFSALVPDDVRKSVFDIPLDVLKSEGKTCFLLDFDNTLGPDHATAPTDYSREFIDKIRSMGFSCCLVSNAKTGRSKGIADALKIPCVTYAHKPRPDGINRAMKLMDVRREECVMVGDQVFTDVIAGRFAGVHTVLVEKYGKKEIWYVVLKRPFEKLVRLIAKY